MKKTIINVSVVTTLVLSALTPGLAVAQESKGKVSIEKNERRRHFEPRFTADDYAALNAARLAGLKAGLELTPEQEKHWSALEKQLTSIATERAKRSAEYHSKNSETRASRSRPDALEKLTRQAQALQTRADNLKKISETASPLYEGLNEQQKRRFEFLLREILDNFHGNRVSHDRRYPR